MSLLDTYDLVRPGQTNSTGQLNAQHNIEFTGMLREQFTRKSVFSPLFATRSVTGTSTVRSFASGKSTIQKRVIGQPMQASAHAFGRTELQVAGYTYIREAVDPLEQNQNSYDSKARFAVAQAEAHARMHDQCFGIAAMKAALATANTYGLSPNSGLDPASQVVLGSATDAVDPGKLYAAIADLVVSMRAKDVDPVSAGVRIITSNATLSLLQQCDLLVNSTYTTHDGSMTPGVVIHQLGIPVIASNNFLGGQSISDFPNDNVYNTYSGNYSKVLMVAVGPDAVLAGESMPLEGHIWQDMQAGHIWVVDSMRAFDAKPDVVAQAGAILLP